MAKAHKYKNKVSEGSPADRICVCFQEPWIGLDPAKNQNKHCRELKKHTGKKGCSFFFLMPVCVALVFSDISLLFGGSLNNSQTLQGDSPVACTIGAVKSQYLKFM